MVTGQACRTYFHMPTTALLSATYFGPIEWYQKLYRYDHIVIEQHDHFVRQTYRNRCVIATTQGLQALTVPVTAPDDRRSLTKTPMADIRVSDHGNWRHLHWNALLSAYGESPFFEFYADDLQPFFTHSWDRLIDFNMAVTHKVCELLDFEPHIRLSESWMPSGTPGDGAVATPSAPADLLTPADFRNVIRPKHPLPDPDWKPRPYHQVYERKYGFQPNLSILDLLFNEGNEAILYL